MGFGKDSEEAQRVTEFMNRIRNPENTCGEPEDANTPDAPVQAELDVSPSPPTAIVRPFLNIVRRVEVDVAARKRLMQGVGSVAARYAHSANAEVRLWPDDQLYVPLLSVGTIVALDTANGRQESALQQLLGRIIDDARPHTTRTVDAMIQHKPRVKTARRPPHPIWIPLQSTALNDDARLLDRLAKSEVRTAVPRTDYQPTLGLGISDTGWNYDQQVTFNRISVPGWYPYTTITLGSLEIADMNQIRREPPVPPQYS